MLETFENATQKSDDLQAIAEVSSGVFGTKDGRGIGHLVDSATILGWANEYLAGLNGENSFDQPSLQRAFLFGVRAEGRFAGQSFVEAEPEVRSEWSSERGRSTWESVRDAVWAGFDRARDRKV